MGYGLLLCVALLHIGAACSAVVKDQWLLAALLLTFAVGDVIMAFMAKQ